MTRKRGHYELTDHSASSVPREHGGACRRLAQQPAPESGRCPESRGGGEGDSGGPETPDGGQLFIKVATQDSGGASFSRAPSARGRPAEAFSSRGR